MAYKVTIINDDVSKIIHSPNNPKVKLLTGLVNQSTNSIDSFNFSFNQSNPASAFIKERKTLIEVFDEETREVEFEGRIKNRTGRTMIGGETVRSYAAEDCLAFLQDTQVYDGEYSGTPSGLLRTLINHHNAHSEEYKHFEIGVCEVDVYKEYRSSGNTGGTNVTLSIGSNATIKPATQYIYNDYGTQLNINHAVRNVTHTVVQYASSGVNAGRYLLRHPNSAWGISGWINADDIVETYTLQVPLPQPTPEISTRLMTNTAVRVKQTATTYYHSDGTRKPIPQFVKDRTHLIGGYNSKTDRYLLTYGNDNIAWIGIDGLEGGSVQSVKPTENPTSYVLRNRSIECEYSYGQDVLDVIKRELLMPFGAELYWEKIEGVRVLNIVNKRMNETENRIAIGLNMISMQENFDPSMIPTRLVPIGTLAEEYRDENAESNDIDISSANSGRRYIDNELLIELYGINMIHEKFSDVTSAYDLLQKAKDFMTDTLEKYHEVTISYAQLHLIDVRYNKVKIGDVVTVQNPMLVINDRMRVTEKSVDIIHSYASDITVGHKQDMLSDLVGRG